MDSSRVDHDSVFRIIKQNQNVNVNPEAATIGENLVNRIINSLHATCRGYNRKIPNDEQLKVYKNNLVLVLHEVDITTKELIKGGVEYARKESPWMPTPGEFAQWCLDALLPKNTKTGASSYQEIKAYYVRPRESREASHLSSETYNTLRILMKDGDLSQFRNISDNLAAEMWIGFHHRTLNTMRQGGSLMVANPPVKKIEADHRPISADKAAGFFASMKQGL